MPTPTNVEICRLYHELMTEDLRIVGQPTITNRHIRVVLSRSLSGPERDAVGRWTEDHPDEPLRVVEVGGGAAFTNAADAVAAVEAPTWGTIIFDLPRGKRGDHVKLRLEKLERLLDELNERRHREDEMKRDARDAAAERRRADEEDIRDVEETLRRWKPSRR